MTGTPDAEETERKVKEAKKALSQSLSLQIPPEEAPAIAAAFGVFNDPVGLYNHLLSEDVNVPPCIEYALAVLGGVDLDDLFIEHMIVAARYFRAKGRIDPDRAVALFRLPSSYFADINPAVTANFTDLQIVDFLDNYETLVKTMTPSAAGHLAVSAAVGGDFDDGDVGYAADPETSLPRTFSRSYPVQETTAALREMVSAAGIDPDSLSTRGDMMSQGVPATLEAAVAFAYGHPDPGSVEPDTVARAAIVAESVGDTDTRERFLREALTPAGVATLDALLRVAQSHPRCAGMSEGQRRSLALAAGKDAVFLAAVMPPTDAAVAALEQAASGEDAGTVDGGM